MGFARVKASNLCVLASCEDIESVRGKADSKLRCYRTTIQTRTSNERILFERETQVHCLLIIPG